MVVSNSIVTIKIIWYHISKDGDIWSNEVITKNNMLLLKYYVQWVKFFQEMNYIFFLLKKITFDGY